ncbi:alpha/beta hydrolase [Rathayibacter sp. AY1A3]|nr:alpha/beta hydrolase [Rathayibacter sp. AY1A3]
MTEMQSSRAGRPSSPSFRDGSATTPAASAPSTHFPPGAIDAQRPNGALEHRSLIYSVVEGYRPIELDVFVPADAKSASPAVVWIHGGGFLTGSRQHPPLEWAPGVLFQPLIDAGIAVVSIDYRHAKEAPFPAQLHDVKAAVRYVRRYAERLGIDSTRIAAWGESAGGQLAALLGLVQNDSALEGVTGVTDVSSAVAAVIDFYGVSDVETMPRFGDAFPAEYRSLLPDPGPDAADPMRTLLEGSALVLERGRQVASPLSHVRADAPPFLLVHGDSDWIVPAQQSEALASALIARGVSTELVLLPGVNHVFMNGNPVPEVERGLRFLLSLGF